MAFNCLRELFSFNCQRRKRRSKERRISSESDSEDVSTLKHALNSEVSMQQEENFDIIDSYSKSDAGTKTKIKKSIQLDKKEKDISKTDESNSSVSSSSSVQKDTKRKSYNGKSLKERQTCNRGKVKITKDGNLANASTVDDFTESLNNLNIKKMNCKLEKINDRTSSSSRKKKSEAKPFNKSKDSETSLGRKGVDVEEYSTGSFSVSSSVIDKRNILTDEELSKINNRNRLALDSDSEIWFLKNKTENAKFNHSLRKKMLEYLNKRGSK